jgi:hypothetical protein
MTWWMDDYLPVSRGELDRRLQSLWSYVVDQTEHITEIGERTMARVDELRDRLAAATDELARDLDDLRGRLAEQDAALAAELEPMVSRLEAMGADPNNPVPSAPGDAGPGAGGGEVINPTPGAVDNPADNPNA